MLSTKGLVSLISISRPTPLFLLRSSRTSAYPDALCGLVLLVSLVSWIVAMVTLLQWRKVSSYVIFLLIAFAVHCISRRQLVGVGVETGLGFISISLALRSRSRSSSAGTLKQQSEQQCGIGRSATKKVI